MSVDEDIELKDLLTQTLEANGCLSKIRAELRASVFLALDEDITVSRKQPLLNKNVKTHLETTEGKAMFSIVREFLEYFNLHFTLSVYESESSLGDGYQYESREKVLKSLDLESLQDNTVPLLLQLIKIAQLKSKKVDNNLNNTEADPISEHVSFNSDSIPKTDIESNINVSNLGQQSLERDIKRNSIENGNMNVTYNILSPTHIIINNKSKVETNGDESFVKTVEKIALDETCGKKEEKDDDTFEDTSSIVEDSTGFNNTNCKSNRDLIENLPDDTLTPECAKEKAKVFQKFEKSKTKTDLNSLSDLPPLQTNKSRVNDILPSLYSKEFKDMSNLKELDKFFDLEAEYEEDFMCSGDDLSLKSNHSTKSNNSLDESQISNKSLHGNKKDVGTIKSPIKVLSDNKPLIKATLNSQKGKIDCVGRSFNGGISSVDNVEISLSD